MRHALDRLLHVQQRGHLPAQLRAAGQHVPVRRQRDAGPVLPQRTFVLLPVRGRVQDCNRVVEERLDGPAHLVQVALGGVRQVGDRLAVGPVRARLAEEVPAARLGIEVHRKAAGPSIHQIETTDALNHLGLRPFMSRLSL